MSYLQMVFPPARILEHLPITRDQLMLLMAAINEIFLSVDILLAHSASGQITRNEWIPILFGGVAGILLLIAGLIAFQYRGAATLLANFVFLGSILVGLLGVYFHLSRTVLLESPGQEPVSALVWAPPLLGPLFFALVGILGISAAWIESPPDSGRLHLLRARTIRMPYSKTRAYFLIVSLFILAALISSVLDHARFNLESGWVWLPIIVSLFAMTASLTLGFIERPNRGDLALFAISMILLILVGLVGFVLHFNTSLIPRGIFVVERFLRGSPLLAPLLFANVGLLGLIILLDPREVAAR
ncbi:MAG: hypothetical protein IPK19_05390 [Chloroflexi bacterium]|nr:hypothetical protein [Chloroflexota bacterium]